MQNGRRTDVYVIATGKVKINATVSNTFNIYATQPTDHQTLQASSPRHICQPITALYTWWLRGQKLFYCPIERSVCVQQRMKCAIDFTLWRCSKIHTTHTHTWAIVQWCPYASTPQTHTCYVRITFEWINIEWNDLNTPWGPMQQTIPLQVLDQTRCSFSSGCTYEWR